ncbi:MAG: hypothetical protein ACK47C_13565 [Paracoccaceae bacterium]
MRTNVILTVVVVLLAAIAIGRFLYKPDTNQPVLITSAWAPGQFLAATEIEWMTLWGQHALTINVSATRETVSFSFPETAIVSICNDILEKMPRAPDGVLKADVYRVNIRKLGTKDVNFPMQVASGRCVDWKTGTILFPNYPPPLQDWRLNSYEASGKGKADFMTFTFAAVRGADAVVEDRTFADACHAVLTEQVLASRNIVQQIQGKVARIKLGKFLGPEGLRVGLWQARDFRVISGGCVPVEADSET